MSLASLVGGTTSSTSSAKTTKGKGLSALVGGTTAPAPIIAPKKKDDLSSVEGLQQFATEKGFGAEADAIVNTPTKLSALQRLSKGLGALNPAEAILTAKEEGLGAGLKKYATGVVKGVGSALTGTDYEGERRTFSDVAEEAGIENKIAKFGIGFLGDVLLDPSTYFGGAIAKGIGTVTKGVGNVGLKALGKVAPESEQGLRMAATGLEDAVGNLFQYGYKATKGAKEDVLTFLSKKQQAQLGLASSNLNRLGTGVLTDDQAKELALKMVAGKRAEFVAREAGKSADEIVDISRKAAESSDPLVQKTINEQIERSKKIGEDIGIENPYEVYFPFIKKDKLQTFLNQTGGIKVGSEGYLKQFKNLLTNENIELNPAKAFFTRESQVVSNKMTRDFLDGFVGKYGKKLDDFKSLDEARAAGFDLIREKGALFGKELGYVPKFDAKLIKDAMDPGFQSINMLAKATGFDAVTSLFKRAVTGPFPAFHVRNYLSGNIQNFEVLGKDALNPKNMAIGSKIAYLIGKGGKMPSDIIELGGKKMKFDKVMKPFTDRFSGDTFYNNDFDLALKTGKKIGSAAGIFSKETAKETLKTAGLGQDAILFRTGRAVGQFIEHQQKATAYITALSQGKSVPEALRLAESAGFDYRALTQFESQIMRRIIPFYSFTRKNIELQLKTLGENPQRINQVLSFFENIGEEIPEEEKKKLPQFIREAIGIKLEDTPEGLKQYISSFGTPIEGFAQLFGSNPILRGISQMNPLLKVPIEIGIGKNSFKQIDLKDDYNAKEYKMAPQIVKDMLDITEVQKPIYEKRGEKLVKVGEKTVYVADPVKLLVARSLFTSRGVTYLDQVFGDDLQGFVKAIKLISGFKPQAIDIEQQKYFQDKDKKEQLEDLLLKRTADFKQFQTNYIPKK